MRAPHVCGTGAVGVFGGEPSSEAATLRRLEMDFLRMSWGVICFGFSTALTGLSAAAASAAVVSDDKGPGAGLRAFSGCKGEAALLLPLELFSAPDAAP